MRTIFYFFLLIYFPINTYAQIDQLELLIQNKMVTFHIPGLAAAIVKKDKICWEGYFGMANFAENRTVDASTTFMLASVSKTITATAVLKLYEQKSFELDDNINDYLPDTFNVHSPSFPNEPITFRQLLTHTSSIKDNWDIIPNFAHDSPIPLKTFVYNYLDTNGSNYNAINNFYTYNPGTIFNYSNIGFALLGYLVEVISGTPFNEFCNNNLFNEMEMNNSRWFLSETDTTKLAMPYKYDYGSIDYVAYGHYGYSDYPDGQLRSTAQDLANFLLTYIHNGKYETTMTTILDSSTVQLLTPSSFNDGLTWQNNNLFGYQIWRHGGGDLGVRTSIGFNPQDSIGVVILTNGEVSPTSIWKEMWDFARLNDFESTVSVSEIPEEVIVKIFPNPNQGSFQVSWQNNNFENLYLFDSDGKLIKSVNIQNKNMIKLDGLLSGHYFIQIRGNQQLLTKKIIVIE